jgi:hypothetical protein
MCRKDGREIYCKAKTDIAIGDLQVPLAFKNIGNLAPVASQDEEKHPLAVPLDVSWQVTDLEKSMGVEQANHILHFKALPEFNPPKPAVAGKQPAVAGKKLEWTPNHSAHLFWAIPRKTSGEPANCEMQFRIVVPIMSAAEAGKSNIWTHGKADAITAAFQVRVPVIVNTVALKADDEVTLKWTITPKKQPPVASRRRAAWVENLEGHRKEWAKKRRT